MGNIGFGAGMKVPALVDEDDEDLAMIGGLTDENGDIDPLMCTEAGPMKVKGGAGGSSSSSSSSNYHLMGSGSVPQPFTGLKVGKNKANCPTFQWHCQQGAWE